MEKNKRGGGPKNSTFQGTKPPTHVSHCLGLSSIIRLASLQPLRRWTKVSAPEWDEEEAVFLPLLLTSSQLLSSGLDKHPHVYAAILGNYCLFTLPLPWTQHDAWCSTTWIELSPVIITQTALLTQILHFRMQPGLEGYIETGRWSPKDRPRNGIPRVAEQVLSVRWRGKLHLRNYSWCLDSEEPKVQPKSTGIRCQADKHTKPTRVEKRWWKGGKMAERVRNIQDKI